MKKIKYKVCIIAIMGMTVFGGCRNESGSENIKAGMELLEQYDYQGAMEYFDAAALNKEDSQLFYRGKALAYMGLGDYKAAEEALLESISYAEGNLGSLEYDINYYLATAYMKQGKYKEAEEIYSAILAMKKKETDAYYMRACALLKQQNYEGAVADFEKAFSLDSDNIEMVTDAYVEMKAEGFEEQGKIYLQEFIQKKEKTLEPGEKGVLYFYLEDYENARSCLDSYVNGNDAELSLILGQTYEKLGDMNYAAVVYQTYLDTNTPDAAIYNSLGICLMNQEKYGEALEKFQAGIDMGDNPYLQNLRFNLIVTNEYLGNFENAKLLMEEYLQMYPDDNKAKEEYVFLQTR